MVSILESFPMELAKMYDYSGEFCGSRLEKPLPESYIVQVIEPMIHRLSITRNAQILDIAAGRGQTARVLKNKLEGATVFASDISHNALSSLKYCFSGVHALQASGDEIPLPRQSVDAVHCKDGIVHFPDLNKLMTELHRVCKKDAVLTISFVPSDTACRVALAGRIYEHTFDTMQDYMQLTRKLQQLKSGGTPVTIGPPYFLSSSKKIVAASMGMFTLVQRGTWELNDTERDTDWYQDSNRIVLTFKKTLE